MAKIAVERKTLFDMTLCAVCAALTCVLAPLSVPSYNPEVPISLATFAVMVSGGLLRPKYAAMSQVIYILLGFAGLPVFAGFTGGVGVLARPSAGYLLGYILMAFVESLLIHGLSPRDPKKYGRVLETGAFALGMAGGTLACYAVGTLWFMAVMQTPLWTALISCVIPFLFGDAVKIAVAAAALPQIRRACQLAAGRQRTA